MQIVFQDLFIIHLKVHKTYSMKSSIITLDSIEEFSMSLSEHNLRWMFESAQTNGISQQVKDEITPLQPEAAQFLLDFRNLQNHLTKELFRDARISKKETAFISRKRKKAEVENWLTERNIPLDRKVFWVNQLNVAFVITWRMVIKFSDVLFFGTDETIWDSSMNWMLTFESDEIFRFTDNLMFNPAVKVAETKIINAILEETLQAKVMEELAGQPARMKDTEAMSNPGVMPRNTVRESSQRNEVRTNLHF